MILFEDWDQIAQDLADANKLPLDTALHYASLIGDTPELGDDGLVIVRENDGTEIARVVMAG